MFKPRLKKIPLYTTVILISLLSVFIYGVTVGGEILFLFWPIMFLIVSAVLITISKIALKGTLGRVLDYFAIILCSALAVTICIIFYNTVNQISSTPIREYDSVVTYRYRDIVYFEDPEGNEKRADLHEDDFKIVYTVDDFISVGDTVHIEEKNGFFDMIFCSAVKCNTQ